MRQRRRAADEGHMKHALLIASLAAFLGPGGVATAQDYQNPSATTAAEIPTVPAGTVMTAPFSEALARDVYVWGWPIVNAFHRRASFAAAPEPGLQDGVLPVAPTGYVGMLHSYISPDQRWVAHPKGTIPGGIAGVIHSPTDLIAMGPRIFLDETDEDRAAIQQVLDQVVVYPLSKFDGKLKTKVWADVPHFKPAASSSSTGGKAAETSWVNPNTFFDELPGILDQVPPLPGEEARYAMVRALLAAAQSDPTIKAAITRAAVETEKTIISPLFDFRTNGPRLQGGWNSPPNVAAWGFDYLTRAATAKSNMYVNQPTETRYFFLEVDRDGSRLDGKSAYTLTFPPGGTPPVNGFWSLTMYDPNHFFASNTLHRYSVGTKNLKAMKANPDGSLTVYIQHDSPGAAKEANWLPAPASNLEMTIRTYWPKPEVNEGRWSLPRR